MLLGKQYVEYCQVIKIENITRLHKKIILPGYKI